MFNKKINEFKKNIVRTLSPEELYHLEKAYYQTKLVELVD